MNELPHSKSCFVCGSQNASGLNLRFETDGRIVRSRFIPGAQHNGFLNVTHGGILATVLDEIMVWACAVQCKRFSYCAEMNVRYLSPATPLRAIIAEGELVENKRDRLYLAHGVLRREDGTPIATSTGKYMPVKDLDSNFLASDFVGTPDQLRLLGLA